MAAARDVSLLRSDPAVAAEFNEHLAQNLRERGLDNIMAELVPSCHLVIQPRVQRYDREPNAGAVRQCASEYAQCEAGH